MDTYAELNIELLIVLFQLNPFLRCQLHTLYPEKVETAASKINRLAIPKTESRQVIISLSLLVENTLWNLLQMYFRTLFISV